MTNIPPDQAKQPPCSRCGRSTTRAFREHMPLYELYTDPDGVQDWHAPRFEWLCHQCLNVLLSTKPPMPGGITIEHYERMALSPRRGPGQPPRTDRVPEFAGLYRTIDSVLRRRLGREPYEHEMIEALAPSMEWDVDKLEIRTFHRWLDDFKIAHPPTRPR